MMLTSFLMTSLVWAQEPPPPPIVGGETTTDFAPVGALLAVSGNQGADFCSGTLVANDWLVTAAHCIEAAEEYDRYGYDVYFCTGTSIYSNSGIDECDVAVDMIPHPDYNSNNLYADIGVIELSTGLRASGYYAMNSDRPGNLTDDMVTYVGWGITDDNANDSGRKRTAEIPLYGYDSGFIYTYDPNEELNLCSGDSGGAALMWDDGDWELIGANSFVASSGGGTCSGRDAYAGATRVDAFYDWLTSYVDLSDNNGGGNNGGGNNGGGNNGGNNDNDNDNDSDSDSDNDSEDTGIGDTAEPQNNNQQDVDGKSESFGSCSSIPLKTSGLLGLAVLGVALAARRDD